MSEFPIDPNEPTEPFTPPVSSDKVAKSSEKKELPTTLVGYLTARTPPAGFLKNLRALSVWGFGDQDRDDALANHRKLDPRFTKTASLMAQALKAKDESHVLPVSDFARQALLERLRDYPHWAGVEWDDLDPRDRAYKVADAVKRKITDSKKGREAQNLFATSLLLLAQEALDAETAVRATSRVLEAKAEMTARRNRERVMFLAGPRSKVGDLRLVLQTMLPWIEKADETEAARLQAVTSTSEERHRRETAEETAQQRAERIRELENAAEARSIRIAELEEELRSSLVHGSHDLDRTRSAVRGLLESRILGLLETATEALELEPPRPHIAKEKVDVARDAIKEQLKWLEQ